MPTWIAALITLGVITTVYLCCIRPMQRGTCARRRGGNDIEFDRQIADLREELRLLRAEDSLESGFDANRPIPPSYG